MENWVGIGGPYRMSDLSAFILGTEFSLLRLRGRGGRVLGKRNCE